MQAVQLPQWADTGSLAGSAMSTKISPKKKHRAGLPVQHQSVLAAPAQAAAGGQFGLEHRRRIGKHPMAQPIKLPGQALRQGAQPRAQHLVVVAATRIN